MLKYAAWIGGCLLLGLSARAAEAGDNVDKQHSVRSPTKSLTGTMLGLPIDDGPRAAEPTPQSADSRATRCCRLTPLRTGVCRLGKDHLLGKPYTAEQRMEFAIYAFLVEGPGGKKALVDLGPKTVSYLNRMFRRYGFFRDLGPQHATAKRYPDDIVQPEGNVFDHLRRLGVSPAGIDHIVFSHLHSDHHGMDDASDGGAAEDFPRAILHASAIGWNDNLRKRKDGNFNSYVDYAFSDFLLRCQAEGKARFEDNAEIFPGLRTMHLGGHSVCSQAVIVDTAEGPAIITSDEVYLYKLLEDNILPSIRTSERRYRAAVDRLVRLAIRKNGVLVPMHDPIVWDTYRKAGREWLKELRKVSDRAVKKYADQAWPQSAKTIPSLTS